jgi:hypothetical protein
MKLEKLKRIVLACVAVTLLAAEIAFAPMAQAEGGFAGLDLARPAWT